MPQQCGREGGREREREREREVGRERKSARRSESERARERERMPQQAEKKAGSSLQGKSRALCISHHQSAAPPDHTSTPASVCGEEHVTRRHGHLPDTSGRSKLSKYVECPLALTLMLSAGGDGDGLHAQRGCFIKPWLPLPLLHTSSSSPYRAARLLHRNLTLASSSSSPYPASCQPICL